MPADGAMLFLLLWILLFIHVSELKELAQAYG